MIPTANATASSFLRYVTLRIDVGQKRYRPNGAGFTSLQFQRKAYEKETLPYYLIQID